MKRVIDNISVTELKKMSEKMFDGLVKAVIDVERGIMIVDAEMHSDQEEVLLEEGSKQQDLWGINIYPDKWPDKNAIEFDSMINLRPSWGNRSRSVDDPKMRERIVKIVEKLIS